MLAVHGNTDPAQQMKNTIYYVVGAALHKCLQLMEYEMSKTDRSAEWPALNIKLRSFLTYDPTLAGGAYEGAKRDGLPCALIIQRQRRQGALIFPCSAIYKLTLAMEQLVLIPLLQEHSNVMSALGNSLSIYLAGIG